MRILFPLLLLSAFVHGQYLFDEPRISGTPLTPDKEQVLRYLEQLQKSDPLRYRQLANAGALAKTSPRIDEERTFQVLNLSDPGTTKFDEKLFVLKKEDSRIFIWVEKAELENNHVTMDVIDDVYDAIAVQTPTGSIDPSKGIYDLETELFGPPPDVNGDGHVNFLLTDIQDGYEESGDSFVGGFFYPHDQTTLPGSNRSDIIYMDSFPGIYTEDNQGNFSYNVNGVLATVAHEFQHLVQYRIDSDEETWANEGFSEIASYLTGYGLRSPDRYLLKSNLSLTAWDREDALPHYARAALWTYYVFEKQGLDAIKEIVRAPESGISGFNAALQRVGSSASFSGLVNDFFKTLSANVPGESSGFVFDWEALQYVRPLPQHRVTGYPFSKSVVLNPYSMVLLEASNGDSLRFSADASFAGNVFLSRLGFGLNERLLQPAGNSYSDDAFGSAYHTAQFTVANSGGSVKAYAVTLDASPRGTLVDLSYSAEEPDFPLTSTGNTNAIKYFAPQDSLLLKSIRFYKNSSISDIRLHVYTLPLTSGSNPASETVALDNVATSGWLRVDLEDLQMMYDADEEIAVGVEFVNEGAMGYDSNDDFSGLSYLKGPISQNRFRPLNSFSAGSTLNGVWLMHVEMLAPGGSRIPGSGSISDLSIGPNPYPASSDGQVIFRYAALGSGRVTLDIFSVDGRKVYSSSSPLSGLFTWDGRSSSGKMLSSGMYIVRLTSGSKSLFGRLILIR